MSMFWPYVLVMAGVTYLIRVTPLVAIRKEVTNRFMLSFLYYVPYACLAAMVFPAILTATSSVVSGVVALLVALLMAYLGRSMVTVALVSCASVFITERLLEFLA